MNQFKLFNIEVDTTHIVWPYIWLIKFMQIHFLDVLLIGLNAAAAYANGYVYVMGLSSFPIVSFLCCIFSSITIVWIIGYKKIRRIK